MKTGTADEVRERMNEIYESFLESCSFENGLIRNVEEGDCVDESFHFMYTQRGMRLVEALQRRLHKIWNKCFPDEELELSSHLYQEP